MEIFYYFYTCCYQRLFTNLRKKAIVYYGGARSGNVGGPLVKLKRLQQFFPTKYFEI